jgi:hypothetical protein
VEGVWRKNGWRFAKKELFGVFVISIPGTSTRYQYQVPVPYQVLNSTTWYEFEINWAIVLNFVEISTRFPRDFLVISIPKHDVGYLWRSRKKRRRRRRNRKVSSCGQIITMGGENDIVVKRERSETTKQETKETRTQLTP